LTWGGTGGTSPELGRVQCTPCPRSSDATGLTADCIHRNLCTNSRDVSVAHARRNKKSCYRRRTAHRDVSVEILRKLLHSSVGTDCTTHPRQIDVTELDGYSRPTCNKLRASSNDALDRRRCNSQARPSTSSADHTIDLPGRNFLSLGLRQNSRGKQTYFRRNPNFLIILQFRIGERKLACQNQLYPSSRFDTIPA